MRHFVVGLIVALVLSVVLIGTTRVVQAQQKKRLQLHGQESQIESQTSEKLQVWCDTGTGTIIFTFGSQHGAAMQLLPNGCAKAK